MRLLGNRLTRWGILAGLCMALLVALGSERHSEAEPPGGSFCPGGLPPHCVQCHRDDCVKACFGDYTCGYTDQNLCFFVEVCD